MTDEQIIKALEICKTNTCKGCSYYEEYQSGVKCLCNLIRDALDLISRQKEKIKEFDGKIIIQQGMIDYQKAEIERLQSRNNFLEIEYKNLSNLFQARVQISITEAIKEFAERLKEGEVYMRIEFPNTKNGTEDYIVLSDDIDDLVKQMTEVNENEK